jgi:hypothetical protein
MTFDTDPHFWQDTAIFGLAAILLPGLPAMSGSLRLGSASFEFTRQSRQVARTLVGATHDSRRSAARLGRHYLRIAPNEQNIETLLALIEQELPESQRLSQIRITDDIRIAISQSIRNDFARGRISKINGWMLSRTEARVAALAALI